MADLVSSFTASTPVRSFCRGMESTTGYCPPVWDLLLALAQTLRYRLLVPSDRPSILFHNYLWNICAHGWDRTRAHTLVIGLSVKRLSPFDHQARMYTTCHLEKVRGHKLPGLPLSAPSVVGQRNQATFKSKTMVISNFKKKYF